MEPGHFWASVENSNFDGTGWSSEVVFNLLLTMLRLDGVSGQSHPWQSKTLLIMQGFKVGVVQKVWKVCNAELGGGMYISLITLSSGCTVAREPLVSQVGPDLFLYFLSIFSPDTSHGHVNIPKIIDQVFLQYKLGKWARLSCGQYYLLLIY